MTLDFNTTSMQNKWKKQIAEAKKNFKKERLLKEFSIVINDAKRFKTELQNQAQARALLLEEQVRNIEKPKEPQRGKDLNAETVALLNYHSKVIQSKLAIEGTTQAGFYKVLEEFSNHEDKNMRWALMDSYHEVMDAGRSLMQRIEPTLTTALSRAATDNAEAFESKLREQYTMAKSSLKSPYELKQEEENELMKSSAESELASIRFQLSQAEKAIDAVILNYQRDAHYFTGTDGDDTNPYFSQR